MILKRKSDKKKEKEKVQELKAKKVYSEKELAEISKRKSETKKGILDRKKLRQNIEKKNKFKKIYDKIMGILNSNRIFKKIYIALILILVILLVFLPKQKYIDGIDYQETVLEVLEDRQN